MMSVDSKNVSGKILGYNVQLVGRTRKDNLYRYADYAQKDL